jgi:hypothetical protein
MLSSIFILHVWIIRNIENYKIKVWLGVAVCHTTRSCEEWFFIPSADFELYYIDMNLNCTSPVVCSFPKCSEIRYFVSEMTYINKRKDGLTSPLKYAIYVWRHTNHEDRWRTTRHYGRPRCVILCVTRFIFSFSRPPIPSSNDKNDVDKT